jgi:hypothetical protein
MYFAKLEKGNRNLDILEMSKKHHILGLFKTGLFYKVFKKLQKNLLKNRRTTTRDNVWINTIK